MARLSREKAEAQLKTLGFKPRNEVTPDGTWVRRTTVLDVVVHTDSDGDWWLVDHFDGEEFFANTPIAVVKKFLRHLRRQANVALKRETQVSNWL